MYENRFTPRAQNALRLAQASAEELGHSYVGSEHLLLGLLREEAGAAHRCLAEQSVTAERARAAVVQIVGTGLAGLAPPQGLTPRARRVVEIALRCNAVGVVLAHNHPSGLALPSREDYVATSQVAEALSAIGVRLVDHIIVADQDFVSMAENGAIAQRCF